MKWFTNRFMKKKDIMSLWEEDGDLKRMTTFFHTIDADIEENEQIKQSIKQKALEKMSKDEELGKAPVICREGFIQRIRTRLRVISELGRWKLGISVVSAAILVMIGQSVMNNASWQLFPRMGNVVQEEKLMQKSTDIASQVTGSSDSNRGALNKSTSPKAETDQKANSLNSSMSSTFDSLAKEGARAPGPLPPDQAIVPPADSSIPRKITHDLTLTLEVVDINDSVTQISREVQQMDGYVVESQQNGSDSHSSAHLTLKIPADKLKGLRDSLSTWGKIRDQHMLANDITNQYYDSQVRLQTLETEEKRYLEILNQAKTVEDVLKVENALGNIRQQIEQLKGQLKLWNNMVDYSAVNLQLVTLQSPNLNVKNPWQPISWSKTWQATQDAVLKTVSNAWNALNYLVVGIGYALPYLFIGALGWGSYRVWRKWKSH